MFPFAGVSGKGKGANPTHPDRGTAKRLWTEIRQAAPVWGGAVRLCPRSLKIRGFLSDLFGYANFVRTGRFNPRPAVPSTPNSGRDRPIAVERREGRQGQRQPRWHCLPKWPVPGRAWAGGAVFTPPRPLHAVQARLRKGTARFRAWSDPTGRARRTRNARHGLNAALPAATVTGPTPRSPARATAKGDTSTQGNDRQRLMTDRWLA